MKEELNEGCGCTDTTENIRSFNTNSTPSKYSQDPLVGKRVSLVDGRKGLVDDSIRNNTGEVIGYVIEGDKGNYRVFKNKIAGLLDESGAPMASLQATPGMGDVIPPGAGGKEGSGDQFPSLTVGTPAAKDKKKDKTKKDPNPISSSIMDFTTFLKTTKKNQDKK